MQRAFNKGDRVRIKVDANCHTIYRGLVGTVHDWWQSWWQGGTKTFTPFGDRWYAVNLSEHGLAIAGFYGRELESADNGMERAVKKVKRHDKKKSHNR